MAFLIVMIWSMFVLCLTVFVTKNYKKGFGNFFEQISAHANFNSYYLVQVCVFKRTLLGPDNNPTLHPKKTCKNDQFCHFCFEDVLKYLFYSVFRTTKFCQKRAPKKG